MAKTRSVNQKTFSIIIAAYNCGQKIEKTIESILSQNKDLFELIIVDGASTDDTLNWINKYENDITLISEKDDGIYYAFNKAIDLARGKYLYFIGAGDCLRNNILETMDKHLTGDAVSFVYGDVYLIKQQIYWTGERSKLNLGLQLINHQSVFYHHKIFDLLGKYDLQYRFWADSAFNLKCFGSRQIKKSYIPHVIADYEGGGLSETMEDHHFQKDFPQLVRKNLGIRSYLKFVLFSDLYYTVYLSFFRPFVRPIVLSIRYVKDKVSNIQNSEFNETKKTKNYSVKK